MPEIQLTGDNTAQVRDIDDIERGDIRAVFNLADRDGAKVIAGDLSMDTFGAIQDAVIVQFVESWTLKDRHGKPLPIDMKAVKRVKIRDYNMLATAMAPLTNEVMSGGQQTTPDPTSEDNSSTSDDTDSTTE